MDNTIRFSFPGFVLTGSQDSDRLHVDTGSLDVGGELFVLRLSRSPAVAYLGREGFLLSEIFGPSGQSVWVYSQDGSENRAMLAMADQVPVIAFVGKGKEGKVERVIPLSNLLRPVQLGLKKLMELKMAAAEWLGRDYQFAEVEIKLQQVLRQRGKEVLEAQDRERRAAKTAEAESRNASRLERLERLLKREVVVGYTVDNRRFYGIPVVGDEWMVLRHNTFVISVSSYNEETGEAGELQEAFRVLKVAGKNPARDYVHQVRPQLSRLATRVEMPRPTSTVMVEIGDDIFPVEVYPSMEVVRTAREAGLNSGTYVTGEKPKPDGRISVFQVFKEEIKTIGLCKPI